MSRRLSPASLARQDRVLATLRSFDLPASADEVARASGETITFRSPCRCKWCGDEHERVRTYPMRGDDARPILRRLVRDGHAEEFRMGQRVYFRAVGSNE